MLKKTMSLDFTLPKFHSLCSSVAQHYPTLTLAEYFKAQKLPERFAIMRHDIDRRAGERAGYGAGGAGVRHEVFDAH